MNVREKLVELLRNAKAAMKAENLSCDIARNMFVADFMMANGVTVQEWISVNNRWPDLELEEVKTDDNDLFPCLAVRKHQRAKNGKYTAKVWYDGHGFIDGDSIDVTDEITHWMPLPQPPKGE